MKSVLALLVTGVFIAIAGCSDDQNNPPPAFPTSPSFSDARLAQDLARDYVLYSDDFAGQFHPGFVSRIRGALCSAMGTEASPERWSVACWLRLTDPGQPEDELRDTVHPMLFSVNLDDITVEIADQ